MMSCIMSKGQGLKVLIRAEVKGRNGRTDFEESSHNSEVCKLELIESERVGRKSEGGGVMGGLHKQRGGRQIAGSRTSASEYQVTVRGLWVVRCLENLLGA
jgi:hypothetical protein